MDKLFNKATSSKNEWAQSLTAYDDLFAGYGKQFRDERYAKPSKNDCW